MVPLAVRGVLLALALGVCPAAAPEARGPESPASSFDASDARYREHGIDPAKIQGRLEGRGGASVTERAPDAAYRDVRSRLIRGGYDAAGCAVYFHPFGSLLKASADRFRVYLFPRRQGRAFSAALSELRQDPLFDTTPGILRHNPLGVWRLSFVRFAPKVFSSPEGLALLEELQKRNGSDLDGTPLLKHVSEVRDLERRGFATVEERPQDGAEGPPWVIWRIVADPRTEGLARDAFLLVVSRPDGSPADREIEQNFLALVQAGAWCTPPMPRLPAFVQPLPIPARRPTGVSTSPIEIRERALTHRFHPDLPPATVWGYDGAYPGPTLSIRRGEPFTLRFVNELPPVAGGFGLPQTVARVLYPARDGASAGFPTEFLPPGGSADQGFGPGDDRSMGWYHDARLGFAAANTARGLAGVLEVLDEFDSGDENDPNASASRLPSGPFDVPLLLSDRRFDVTLDHAPAWEPFEVDGAPGDFSTVNGAVLPYYRVARRKYRFRIVNSGPSRFAELFIPDGPPFILLGRDGRFLETPVRVRHLRLSPGGQVDAVLDFSETALGTELVLENALPASGGRGPLDRRILKFIVDRDAPDPSRIPSRLSRKAVEDPPATLPTRTFVLENRRGAWTVNGNVLDLDRPDARVKSGATELWILKNASENRTLPIPTAVEGRAIRPPDEWRPGTDVRLLLRFGPATGRFMLPCGTAAQADLGLMIRWDVEP